MSEQGGTIGLNHPLESGGTAQVSFLFNYPCLDIKEGLS